MTYLDQLTTELNRLALPQPRIDEILSDIQGLLDDGVSEADLGEPAALASALADLEADRSDRVAGVYDLENPRLFTRKVVGCGWDLNVGALAVKLGLLRPDDLDDEVLAAIPASTKKVLGALPLALAGTSTALAVATLASGRGLVTNMKTEITRGYIVGPAMTLAGTAVAAWTTRATSERDALYRTSLASAFNAILTSVNAIGVSRADKARPGLGALPAITGLATQAATFIVPLRLGRARVARD